ncbi:WXG100 family type VII secretion target [Nocardia panacis]|uniref:ESAT-6-like protein n=1 Tax=Nocardia panacis TaxID=2340916 RepID=A0A3A4KFL8_9NOCA|nr:WXG100 family type VII secretion target [Nocardia panacis]RJO72136.1 WXG100 family type VII secretion target [Nocardia panacis]
MAGNLTASTDDIDAFANSIRTQHDSLSQAIQQLRTLEHNTSASWNGEAAKAFTSFMEIYFSQAARMNDQLQETADKIAKASGKTTDHDQHSAKAVSAVIHNMTLPN